MERIDLTLGRNQGTLKERPRVLLTWPVCRLLLGLSKMLKTAWTGRRCRVSSLFRHLVRLASCLLRRSSWIFLLASPFQLTGTFPHEFPPSINPKPIVPQGGIQLDVVRHQEAPPLSSSADTDFRVAHVADAGWCSLGCAGQTHSSLMA